MDLAQGGSYPTMRRMRRWPCDERAVAHNPGKDLEGQGFTPLANIGSGFGDLSDKAKDGGPNLAEPKRLIARPHLDDERTILIDLARGKRKHRVGLPACRSQVR